MSAGSSNEGARSGDVTSRRSTFVEQRTVPLHPTNAAAEARRTPAGAPPNPEPGPTALSVIPAVVINSKAALSDCFRRLSPRSPSF